MHKQMRFVAVNGSERTDGNTREVLGHAAELLAGHGVDLEVINLGEKKLTGCGPCGDCNSRCEPCVVTGDDVPEIVDRMALADGIIWAAPVHGFGPATTMQAFIERAGVGYLRFQRPLTNKVGGVVVIGRRYSHTEVYNQLVANVLLNRMIMVGSGFPAILYGNHRGEALADTEGVEMLDRMLHRMVAMARLLAEHRELTGRDALATDHANERDDRWFARRYATAGQA
ncbi:MULTISPECIES: flavodoxin family protein [unclassified Micromonospora]|uniref:flavodoxin family protein n=1 Tax=unclassified Micromonospora TaxID=2617518 RepID=UPI00098D30B8|nr:MULTISPECIES: flavodoxin family protein [unclassified Micromonospora]OON27852.1 NADPH-dependent FMN reductase [Micromonospora sp. Rc5]